MNELSFNFITDESVRNVIEEYWSQATKAKNCEVFAGSCISLWCGSRRPSCLGHYMS